LLPPAEGHGGGVSPQTWGCCCCAAAQAQWLVTGQPDVGPWKAASRAQLAVPARKEAYQYPQRWQGCTVSLELELPDTLTVCTWQVAFCSPPKSNPSV
jgi:hypothetical protein